MRRSITILLVLAALVGGFLLPVLAMEPSHSNGEAVEELPVEIQTARLFVAALPDGRVLEGVYAKSEAGAVLIVVLHRGDGVSMVVLPW